jgi:hypothetical protein
MVAYAVFLGEKISEHLSSRGSGTLTIAWCTSTLEREEESRCVFVIVWKRVDFPEKGRPTIPICMTEPFWFSKSYQ